MRYEQGKQVNTLYLRLYLSINRAVYVRFNGTGESKLMPSSVIDRWNRKRQLHHQYFKAIPVESEQDIINRVINLNKQI